MEKREGVEEEPTGSATQKKKLEMPSLGVLRGQLETPKLVGTKVIAYFNKYTIKISFSTIKNNNRTSINSSL